MQAIRNMPRLQCPRARGLGARARLVAADDDYARMSGKTVAHRPRRAARQQVDDAILFEVADDGAESSAAPPSPVVDTDHGRRRRRLGPAAADQAQDSVTADRHRQPL